MRKTKFAPGEYYHLLNRGNGKQNIFIDDKDRFRLLLAVLYFQAPITISNVSYSARYFGQHRVLPKNEEVLAEIEKSMEVQLVAFAFMPNHFHLLVGEVKEGGISKYMQRTQNAFTKYSNTKYEKSGHLFQGPFKAVHIKDDSQLLYLSAYIHRNPRQLKGWKDKERFYPWSSYQDYVSVNRWGILLKPDIVLEQFKDAQTYLQYVKESGAKEIDPNLLLD